MSLGVKDVDLLPLLAFTVEEALVSCFNVLVQQGVTVRARVGCSVDAFLREEMKAGTETIMKIQSIILDGRPVDDLTSALIRDGSVVALSAAMPGLVGATLRRGGAYSSFRSAITYHETGERCSAGEGFVKVKIFNLLMADLGRDLLNRGVIVSAAEASDFFAGQPLSFWQGCRQITLDRKTLASGNKPDAAWLAVKRGFSFRFQPGRYRGAACPPAIGGKRASSSPSFRG